VKGNYISFLQAGLVAGIGGMRHAYNEFYGNPEGKRSVGKLEMIWEKNIEMDLRHDVRVKNILNRLRIGTSDGF
jgi:hypothetical protein